MRRRRRYSGHRRRRRLFADSESDGLDEEDGSSEVPEEGDKQAGETGVAVLITEEADVRCDGCWQLLTLPSRCD